MTPIIIMVGADKGGVGKTTVARGLAEYFVAKQLTARVFDTEYPKGDLSRFVKAEIINIEKLQDQMKVFDTTDGITLVDVRGGQLGTILNTLDQAHLLDDVRAGKMKLILLHVLGPSVASLSEIHEVAQRIQGAKHFFVRNHINETEYLGWQEDDRFKDVFAAMAPLTINVPHLPAVACEAVQRVGGLFTSFVSDVANQSRVLRGYVQTWVEKMIAEFDQVKLGDQLK